MKHKKTLWVIASTLTLFIADMFLRYGWALPLTFLLFAPAYLHFLQGKKLSGKDFLIAFTTGFAVWFFQALFLFNSSPLLTLRLAKFLKLSSPQILVLITAFVGGLYALALQFLLHSSLFFGKISFSAIWRIAWFSFTGILLATVLLNSLGKLPPLLLFFNPNTGFWQNQKDEIQRLKSLKKELKNIRNASVVFDERLVPHIQAENDKDLLFLQGYVEASLRLWQMDVQIRAAQGRISEIIGEKALDSDKFFRRIGIPYAAEVALKELEKYPETLELVRAYAEGVNTYIRSLEYKDFPVEYKLMQFEPEEWTPLKTMLLIKLMAWRLLGPNKEQEMTRALLKYGKAAMDSLFPDYLYLASQEPIIPKETHFDFEPVKIPNPPQNPYSSYEYTTFADSILFSKPEAVASNNWAVAGSKTRHGKPILCNDPHLALNLPAIWIEMHLIGKSFNVYGVSLLGAPGITIGFNENIAWGLTNVGPDVMDLYLVKKQGQKYFYKGKWHDFRIRPDTLKVKGKGYVIDTLYFTDFGLMLDKDIAVRWTAYEPSCEARTFLQLNKARNYEDYKNALKTFGTPAQNFVYADTVNIALWSNGKFPLRWKGQGKFLGTAHREEYHWKNFVPQEQNPHVKNPLRGFVSSANQPPVNEKYPYYLGFDFENFKRGTRINRLLRSMQNITIDSMMKIQLDEKNMLAEYILPTLLENTDTSDFTPLQKQAWDTLRAWNYFHSAGSIGASIFKEWWKNIEENIWKDELGKLKPKNETTAYFIKNFPDSRWFDNIKTPEKETLSQILTSSYVLALKNLEERFGNRLNETWRWAKYKHTSIPHMAFKEAFGIEYLEVGGGKGIVNAIGAGWGPSWRMIVKLGKKPEAYGIYPGGQSGNPGSPYYDNFVLDWAKGNYYKLHFVSRPSELKEKLLEWQF